MKIYNNKNPAGLSKADDKQGTKVIKSKKKIKEFEKSDIGLPDVDLKKFLGCGG